MEEGFSLLYDAPLRMVFGNLFRFEFYKLAVIEFQAEVQLVPVRTIENLFADAIDRFRAATPIDQQYHSSTGKPVLQFEHGRLFIDQLAGLEWLANLAELIKQQFAPTEVAGADIPFEPPAETEPARVGIPDPGAMFIRGCFIDAAA